MRIVAKFQFVAPTKASGGVEQIAEVVQQWGAAKFEQDAAGSTVIRRSGVAAEFDLRRQVLGSSTEIVFHVLEPVPGGLLQTQVKILEVAAKRIGFQCALALDSDSGLLPPRVDIRSPRFIRDIINLGNEWRVADGAERIFAKFFKVEPKDVETLRELIGAPQRRLPVIVVSELQGETLGKDIHERISADTCGLAHTCHLSAEASWELTRAAGKEWSCYNGAVRVFWPFRLNRDDYRARPLWTRDFLMRRTDDEVVARDRFREELTERLIEASTFVADDPAFGRFDTEKVQSVHDAERANAGGDFKALEDSYVTENDALRTALAAARKEVETLQQNVESLMIALRSRERADEQLAAPESPPETVADAVATARNKLTGVVAFASSLDDDVATLDASAGPPDKVLRYLLTLGDLSRALQGGKPLGRSVPIWLRDENVECSGESETVKASKAARARRTFNIASEDRYCEYHAKPSDGVAPDLCVRIYFTTDNTAPHVRVGYVCRHFD
jgi:hypothetical protein